MPTRLWSVVSDANDHGKLAQFWSEALGWSLEVSEDHSRIKREDGLLPRLEFVPVPEPKTSKNRIHLDLSCGSDEDRDRIVERLLSFGAAHVDIGQPPTARHVVLADPEGNEFCVARGTLG